ncbi:MAG: hypothetical protein B6V02_01500 [Thermoprotei archaeon ex4572_64]|nr:MAG: hypothetical protein B6V02_01500 [Thermoprotei archaeon ex4572_64]
MTSYIKIIDGATTYTIPGTSVSTSYTVSTVAKQRANGGDIVEVQTQSVANPLYAIKGVHFTGKFRTGEVALTQDVLVEWAKRQYDGTNYLTLQVGYGPEDPEQMTLKGYDLSSSIKVILKSFNFPLNTTNTTDAYMPVGDMILQETK